MVQSRAKLVTDRIAETIETAGVRPAVWAHGRYHSFTELNSSAVGISQLLSESGSHDSNPIGLITGDDFLTYASLLGIWYSGRAYVPLNKNNPPNRNESIIDEAGITRVLSSFASDAQNDCLPNASRRFEIVDSREAVRSDRSMPLSLTSDDLAYLFFTSGSTGRPKGVPITHGNLSSFMNALLESMELAFCEDDRFLQMFEMTFDLSVMSIFAPWSVGACCYIVPDRGIQYMNIAQVMEKEKITVALLVPSVLAYLRRYFDELCFRDLRLSLFCGEPLAQDDVRAWARCVPNARIENVYGPTEATIFCTSYTWDPDKSESECVNGIVPIGRPMSGTEVAIVDSNGRLCDQNTSGELLLSGPQVMRGYWQDPEKTTDALVEAPFNDGKRRQAYRTGDIAYLNHAGNLIFCGRADSQVKIDGHRVELQEIEHLAREYTGSSMAAVVLDSSSGNRHELHLFVLNGEFESRLLESHLKDHLPHYMVPTQIVILDEMPLNLNGKIDRRSLAEYIGGSQCR